MITEHPDINLRRLKSPLRVLPWYFIRFRLQSLTVFKALLADNYSGDLPRCYCY